MIRLFIDPGSKSLGYCLFEDKELVFSGTIKPPNGMTIGKRLTFIRNSLKKILEDWKIDEVHIEQLNYKTHHFTLWSVGVLVELFSECKVDDDISVSSWKAFFSLKRSDKGDPVNRVLKTFYNNIVTKSDDEAESILLAIYFLNKGEKKANGKR